uniref:Uncharacterized protein n=1 Tax=Colletotrichum fructicola (strain Nara gc5) TaxID=1213859 RepID=L2FBD5_COLFN
MQIVQTIKRVLGKYLLDMLKAWMANAAYVYEMLLSIWPGNGPNHELPGSLAAFRNLSSTAEINGKLAIIVAPRGTCGDRDEYVVLLILARGNWHRPDDSALLKRPSFCVGEVTAAQGKVDIGLGFIYENDMFARYHIVLRV